MATIATLASEAYDAMETRTRDDGTNYVTTKDDAPQWVQDLAHDAHGTMLPDDWRYDAIHSVLSALSCGADEDDPGEIADTLVDTYTGDRLRWLASHMDRVAYCDDAAEEFGAPDCGIVERIGWGQYMEASEIVGSVVESLRARLEEVED